MTRALISAVVALSLASPLHNALLSQQSSVVQAGKSSSASMTMLPMTSSSAAAKMHATLGQRALETNHPAEAAQHFQQAIAADSTLAFARLVYVNVYK